MTAHARRLPFGLDPLIKEARRRARHRRTLIILAVLLLGLAAGLTLALRSPGGPSGPGALVRASYPKDGVSFRAPVNWTRLPCPGVVLTTGHPERSCWPREPLGPDGVTLQVVSSFLPVSQIPGVQWARWDERIAGHAAWAPRPVYDYDSWQSCPAAVRGKDYIAVIRSPLDRFRAITARAVVCGPNVAAGHATVERMLASLLFTRSHVSVRHARPRHLTTAGNRRAAKRSAVKLLGLVVLPPGAVRLGAEPKGDRGLLRHALIRFQVERHRFWRVHAPLGSVFAFFRSHPSPGSRLSSKSSRPYFRTRPASRMVEFTWRPIAGRVSWRALLVDLVKLPHGWTGVRADSQTAWLAVRPAAERVPAGVREVDVRVSHVTRRVTEKEQVRSIVRSFNALPLGQVGGKCAVPELPEVRLAFRSAGGAVLARAAVPQDGQGCVGIAFTIHGRAQPALGDQYAFIRSLQRLLGCAGFLVRPCEP